MVPLFIMAAGATGVPAPAPAARRSAAVDQHRQAYLARLWAGAGSGQGSMAYLATLFKQVYPALHAQLLQVATLRGVQCQVGIRDLTAQIFGMSGAQVHPAFIQRLMLHATLCGLPPSLRGPTSSTPWSLTTRRCRIRDSAIFVRNAPSAMQHGQLQRRCHRAAAGGALSGLWASVPSLQLGPFLCKGGAEGAGPKDGAAVDRTSTTGQPESPGRRTCWSTSRRVRRCTAQGGSSSVASGSWRRL